MEDQQWPKKAESQKVLSVKAFTATLVEAQNMQCAKIT